MSLAQLPLLQAVPSLLHAFETRDTRIQEQLPEPLARIRQIHGATVAMVRDRHQLEPYLGSRPTARPDADAILTDLEGVTLAISTADCLPLLIAAPRDRVIAAVHAGWRGVVLGIIPKVLAILAREFGIDPSACLVGIGPGIGKCCYEVGRDVRRAFEAADIGTAAFGHCAGEPTTTCDLSAAAIDQLHRSGVPPQAIATDGRCTACQTELFWSYRRQGSEAGRMLSGIALSERD